MEYSYRETKKVGRLSKHFAGREGKLVTTRRAGPGDPIASAKRLREALQASPNALWVVGKRGEVLLASTAAALDPRRQLAGDAIHPEDREKFQSALAEARRTFSHQARWRNLEGREFHATLTNFEADPAIAGILIDARDVTEETRAEQELRRRAELDALTGLANRETLLQAAEKALEGGPIGILFFDVDDFKLVNNSLGHHAGDQLLVVLAGRLAGALRQIDLASRQSGDEFAVLLTGVGEDELESIGQRILAAMEQPLELLGRTVTPSLSLGAAHSSSGDSPESLIRNADLALMKGRSSGRGRVTLYEPHMNANLLERLELESELREAIEKRQFELFYQPIVDQQTLEILQLEALIRWNSPTRGMVSPLKFIPIAEETGLIVPIGAWVLREGMMQAQEWRLRHGLENLTINLNLSTRQLLDPGLLDQAREALFDSEIPADRVKLEITESVMMENLDENLAKLLELRKMGLGIAVDDFGTGYSSLAYLSRLPLSTLKVDRSFVSRLGESDQDDAIVRSIVGLARSLGLTVTCEGVETAYQLQRLREFGCDFGQGYFFYKPMSARDVGSILEEDAMMRRAA